jgi:hypothetical protein
MWLQRVDGDDCSEERPERGFICREGLRRHWLRMHDVLAASLSLGVPWLITSIVATFSIVYIYWMRQIMGGV